MRSLQCTTYQWRVSTLLLKTERRRHDTYEMICARHATKETARKTSWSLHGNVWQLMLSVHSTNMQAKTLQQLRCHACTVAGPGVLLVACAILQLRRFKNSKTKIRQHRTAPDTREIPDNGTLVHWWHYVGTQQTRLVQDRSVNTCISTTFLREAYSRTAPTFQP